MKLPRTAAAAAAAVLFLATAGCGSAEDEAEPLSSAEFKEQADKICADDRDDMAALEPAEDATAEEQDQAYRDLADLLLEQADKLGELAPPEDIADEVEAMLDSLEEGAEVIKEEGANVVTISPNPLEDASKKALALGLDTCGQ